MLRNSQLAVTVGYTVMPIKYHNVSALSSVVGSWCKMLHNRMNSRCPLFWYVRYFTVHYFGVYLILFFNTNLCDILGFFILFMKNAVIKGFRKIYNAVLMGITVSFRLILFTDY